MVNTVKIPDLPIKLEPVGNDLAVIADSQSGNSLKKIQVSTISAGLDYTSALSTDADNLLNTDASNKLLLRAGNELISTQANNNLSVGSDGKLYGAATSITLPEGQFLVGNALNQPVATPPEEAKLALGLPIDYKNVSVIRDSGTQVTVQGKCRSEQDDIDLELPSATPVALLTPAMNTRYNLFFAKVNDTSPTVAFFDTSDNPAGYNHYRIIASIPTDGLSNLSNFTYDKNYLEVELWSGNVTSGVQTLSDNISNYNTVEFKSEWGGNRQAFIRLSSESFINSSFPLGESYRTGGNDRTTGYEYTTDNTVTVSNSGVSLLSIKGFIYNV